MPDIPDSLAEILFEKSKIYKEYMSPLTFCHPEISRFLIAAISFVNDWEELKLSQTTSKLSGIQFKQTSRKG